MYTKNTWIARTGTDLNRVVDQNGIYYLFEPAPTLIIQQGTPFTAEWMNNIEQGIDDINGPNGYFLNGVLNTANGGAGADYVAETGTQNGWNYRQWGSGKIEMSATVSVSVGTTTLWAGDIYYGSANISLPEVFLNSQNIYAMVTPSSTILCWVCGVVATDNNIQVYCARPANTTSTLSFTIHVEGVKT